MLWLLFALLWGLAGWLPTRIMKHYFVTEYACLGDRAWTFGLEFVAGVLAAIAGPVGAVSTLICAWMFCRDRGIPLGWTW